MFFSTQGNMRKRGAGATAKPSAAVGAGDAGVVEVVDDTEGQGRGEKEEPTNISKKAKITSVRELGETSKPPTKITKKKKKKQDQDDLTRQFINILQNEDKTKEEEEIDMALGAIGIRIRRSLNEEQQEDLMEEINMVVNCHIKNARASRPGIFSRAPTATVTQQQMSQLQQQQHHQGQNLPLMPSLQNIQHQPLQLTDFEGMQEGMQSFTNL